MNTTFEKYPFYIVLMSNALNLLIYTSGILILLQAGIYYVIPYIAYILVLEIRLLKSGCTRCYYYGKTCAFGKGRVSSILFSKDESKNFCDKQYTKLGLMIDSLVSVAPLITGIVLMILDFSFSILLLCIAIVLFTTAGNGIIRGKFACKFCKQRELGCPAEKVFQKG